VTEVGAAYVDGAVLAYPGAVGTDELLILYSGDPEAFEATRPLLEQLGGTAMHVGEDPGAASVLEIAGMGPAMMMAAGIWQGAKICELEGVPFETFAELTKGIMPAIAEDSLRKAADPGFATNPEKIEGTVEQMAHSVEHVAEYFEEVGLDAGMMWAMQRLYQAGVEEGRGEHDMCCVAELHADPLEPTAQ
jgi:3-hydroxyisobutyrate dehydrogenase-like beta-hydroxyacid dehydrogenase